jgi:lipoprotein NlpD
MWQWPTQGRIVSRFGASGALATGVAIAGTTGQDVVAAADGRVEYVGVGLVEYGQLIIISHGDTWISAYGYLDAVFIAEKQAVRRGQKIAEMGTGPGRQPRLHFEIRRYGEAVDPMPLLPPTR